MIPKGTTPALTALLTNLHTAVKVVERGPINHYAAGAAIGAVSGGALSMLSSNVGFFQGAATGAVIGLGGGGFAGRRQAEAIAASKSSIPVLRRAALGEIKRTGTKFSQEEAKVWSPILKRNVEWLKGTRAQPRQRRSPVAAPPKVAPHQQPTPVGGSAPSGK